MWTAKDARRSRPYTTALLESVQDGVLDPIPLVADLLSWMSEAEVEQVVRASDLLEAICMEDEDEVD